ncbi:MAG: hypothetical protein IPK26_13190 [Planctomycetes bacterium]|nr:hypothetical protein [Planctomycetota bacterium]
MSNARLVSALRWLAIAFAAIGVAGFGLVPIESILRDWSSDDSFYYAQVARRFANGEGSTFDGVEPTNGYHALWMLLQVPLHWLIHEREGALRAIKMIEVLLALASFLLLQNAIRRAAMHPAVAAIVLVLLARTPLLYQGIETGLLLTVVAGTFVALQWHCDRPGCTSWWALASLLLLLPLARLEAAALVPFVACYAAVATVPGGSRRLAAAAKMLVVPGLGLGSYALVNHFAIGSAVPISGIVKGFWSHGRGNPPTWQGLISHLGVLLGSGQVRDGLLWGGIAVMGAALARGVGTRISAAQRAGLAFLIGLSLLHAARLLWFGWTTAPPFGSYAHYWIQSRLLRYFVLIALTGLVLAWFVRRNSWLVVAGACGLLAWAVIAMAFSVRNFVAAARDSTPDWEIASRRGAAWLDANLHEPVGSFDAGVLGYFSTAPVSNWDGLISSPAYVAAVVAGDGDHAAWRSGRRVLANVVPVATQDIAAWLRWKWCLQRPPVGRFELIHVDTDCTPVIDGELMQFRVYRWLAP